MRFTILISGGVLFLGGIKAISKVSTEVSISFYLGVFWMILGIIFCYIGLLNQNKTK